MLALIIISTTKGLGAQTAQQWFERGLESFRWQRTEEAVYFFRQALEISPVSDEYYLYLGMSLHSAELHREAEEIYGKGMALGGENADRIHLRRGNLRWSVRNIEGAREDFSALAEGRGVLASSALLNRANLELTDGSHQRALEDYSAYLAMEPRAPDRENIEKIIAMLAAEAESARLAEAKRKAEEARLAEEEAKRQALMAEIMETLSDSGDETKSISAGSESIQEDLEDSALEE